MPPTLRHSVCWALRSQLSRPSSPPFLSAPSLASRIQPANSATISTATKMNSVLRLENEPHAYTSGRWVFIFTLDNAKIIIVKLLFRLAGPAKLTTLSEVATILDYNHDARDGTNTVGSEYIIMEHATRVPLREKWYEMAGDRQVRCIDAIYRTMREIVDLEFLAFGSIYFDDTLDSASKHLLGDGFCIGPHCATRYWGTGAGKRRYYYHAKANQGPWLSIDQYCEGFIDAGLSRVPPVDTEPERKPIYHGLSKTHLALLERTCSVLKRMAIDTRISNSATPLLFYPDLHMRNIFVLEDDFSTITTFWYFNEVPDLATGSKKDSTVALRHKQLRTNLSGLLNIASAGWELFDAILEAVLTNANPDGEEPVKDEKALRSIWPFDID
ncbi:hypothetical protein P170DRAFT_445376 [Aspergillus steynii IBT 23096]|uniref:Aminoglycoside phosphotransferase domain-containing protein n=1 Tax=Aspergillus steynii IBT 23096 TaxID=1392250 RepID=A0A2I2GAR4_9EURO|nr:uncharacterized protein P170DRAFT_445376 [Aspergillus steynii IBT 23096]PLB49957.1 hypothetical protein P170DRAFT_445376 [Aspergillus steynii IBT 23096]